MKYKSIKLIAVLALCAQTAFAEVAPAAAAPEYAVESVSGIIRELGQEKYEKPFKEWLKKHRPAQYKRLFERDNENKDAPQKEAKSDDLFSSLVELSAAIVDPQIAMLDFYINTKSEEGWVVVSLTDKVVLFRRASNSKGEQGGGGQPATRPESK